jgi:hypothetical protein
MATQDFKVKNGLVVGPNDFDINISTDVATFASGYTVNIGTNRVLKQGDNISELVNDASYIDLTGLSGGTGVTYDNTTGVISIGQDVATTASVTFDTVTAGTKVVTSTIESSGADVTVDDNLIVTGNLTVQGTTTTLNTATLDVEDLNITVAKGAADATAADGAGLTADLGTDGTATFTYDATNDRWTANKSIATNLIGNVTGQVSDISNHDTDDLAEGTNLYFTQARARAAISVDGDLSYNSTTGVISYTTPTNVSDFTNDANYITLTDLSVTGDSALSYNNATGVFEFTVPGSNGNLFYNDGGVIGAISETFFDDVTGRLGFGQTTPVAPIHITKEAANSARLRIDQYNNTIDAPDIQFYKSRGTEATKVGVSDNDVLSDLQTFAYDGTAFKESGRMRFLADGTDADSEFILSTRVSDALANRFMVTNTGQIKFGNSYTFPLSDGSGNQVLTSDGSGNISFAFVDYANVTNTPTNLSDFNNDTNYITLTDLSATGSLSYDNTTGVFSYTERTDSEIRQLFSGTGDISYDNTTGVISFNNSTGFITDPGVASITGTANEIVVSQSTGAVQIGLANDVVIQGNLTVKGTTTTVESNTVSLGDNILVLNNDVTGTPTENAGLEIERGTEVNVSLRWNETNDRWEFTNDGFVYKNIPVTISDLPNDANYVSELNLQQVTDTGAVTTNRIEVAGLLSDNIELVGNTIQNIDTNADLILNTQGTGSVRIDDTGAFIVPVGTEAERPLTPEIGMFRYNSDKNQFEGYNGVEFAPIGGGKGSVIDEDEDTKITVDTAPASDEDVLRFFVGSNAGDDPQSKEMMSISRNGVLIDGTIQIRDNVIEQVDTNRDLILRAAGTGRVIIEGSENEGSSSGNIFAGDPLMTLNYNAVGTNQVDMGLIFERGSELNRGFIYDESLDEFAFISTLEQGTVKGDVTITDYQDISVGTVKLNSETADRIVITDSEKRTRTLDPGTSVDVAGSIRFLNTGGLKVPTGDTATGGYGEKGQVRYNDDAKRFEGNYGEGYWGPIAVGTGTGVSSQSFIGDGVTYNFLLDQATSASQIMVAINGVVQQPEVAYTVTQNILTFIDETSTLYPPESNASIDVRFLSSPATSTVRHYSFVGDGSTTTFEIDSKLVNKDSVLVFVDNIFQDKAVYELDGDFRIRFIDEAPLDGDRIEIINLAVIVVESQKTKSMLHAFKRDENGNLIYERIGNGEVALTDGNGNQLYDDYVIGTDDGEYSINSNGQLVYTFEGNPQ